MSAAPPPTRPATGRKRAPSFSEAIAQVPQNANAQDETADPAVADRIAAAERSAAKDPVASSTSVARSKKGDRQHQDEEIYRSQGLIKDIFTFRWMTAPASSAQLAALFVLAYFNWNFFIGTHENNPIAPFLMLSHRVPQSEVILDSLPPRDSVQRTLQNLIPRSQESMEARYQKDTTTCCSSYSTLSYFPFSDSPQHCTSLNPSQSGGESKANPNKHDSRSKVMRYCTGVVPQR